jgi:recombinational DNA repair protein (RecF pathway)
MKNVFEKVRAECSICGTPLNGDNVLRRGNKYYCHSHYEKTSPSEKQENNFQKKRDENYHKIFRQ